MATTTNFGWETPDDTDLVKDGALAMRTLGNAIDTSLVDLKGGTTGQVLSKTSNTDMDFTWVTSDDANAIQNAIVDAKGDLIAASAADTPARLAVGNNGETLVADSSTSTGLRWQGNYAAGKNLVINGDMRLAQRGTSFSNPNGVYTLDRYRVSVATAVPTWTVSQETFTAGTAPAAGYEATNFLRMAVSSQGSSTAQTIATRLEDVRLLAGQTATFSFWAKAGSTITISDIKIGQNFGSGGSGAVETTVTLNSTSVTTSWARYSGTVTIPSISGKTIGTGSYIYPSLSVASSQGNYTLDLWGWQLEAGNTATAFQTATGTLAGELQLAQRYYWRSNTGQAYSSHGSFGVADTTTTTRGMVRFPVTMRSRPSAADFSNIACYDPIGNAFYAVSAISMDATATSADGAYLYLTMATATVNRVYFILANNNTAGYIGFTAEL